MPQRAKKALSHPYKTAHWEKLLQAKPLILVQLESLRQDVWSML